MYSFFGMFQFKMGVNLLWLGIFERYFNCSPKKVVKRTHEFRLLLRYARFIILALFILGENVLRRLCKCLSQASSLKLSKLKFFHD